MAWTRFEQNARQTDGRTGRRAERRVIPIHSSSKTCCGGIDIKQTEKQLSLAK